jgi:hypothetical protein
MLLRSAIVGGPLEMQTHILTELVGVQMLLINTLEPLLCGDKISRGRSPGSSAEFRQIRPRRHRNSSLGVARTRSDDQGNGSTMWGKEPIVWPSQGYIVTLGAFVFACILTGSFIYICLQFGFLPLQGY